MAKSVFRQKTSMSRREISRLTARRTDIGGIGCFIGLSSVTTRPHGRSADDDPRSDAGTLSGDDPDGRWPASPTRLNVVGTCLAARSSTGLGACSRSRHIVLVLTAAAHRQSALGGGGVSYRLA